MAAILPMAIASALALHDAETRLPPRGMNAAVYAGHDFDAPASWSGVDTALDPVALAARAGLDPARPFAVQWDGLLVVEEAGTYHLRIRADDGAAVWVNDRLVADVLDSRQAVERSEAVVLEQGLQPVRVRYAQAGGEADFLFTWAAPSWREGFHPVFAIPADTVPPPVFGRIHHALAWPSRVAFAWSLWILAGLALALTTLVRAAGGRALWATLDWRLVTPLVIVSTIVIAATVDVGTQPWRGWAADEIGPRDLLAAARDRFAGGWFHLYPPLQFYLLGLVTLPFIVMHARGWLSYEDFVILEQVHELSRLVSVTQAVLTLIAVWLLANHTVGRARGTLAPWLLLGVPMFVFYGRTANVDLPYVFWFTLAALALVNALADRTRRSHVMLGAMAAAAMATKDQAYAFFPGAALLVLWYAWAETAPHAWTTRVRRTLLDPRIWAGLLTFLLIYALCLGTLWNPGGVRGHFDLISGDAPRLFRMFPATPDGVATVIATSLAVLWAALGTPTALAAIAGLLVTAWRAASVRRVLPLLVLAASYLLTFIAVIGYVYDRFLLGLVVVAVILASLGLTACLETIRHAGMRRAVTALVMLALLSPAIALDLRIANDTRFETERWMAAHLTDDPVVLGTASRVYMPNLFPYGHHLERTTFPMRVLSWDADVIVMNKDWLERPWQPKTSLLTSALTDAGYREIFEVARPATPHWFAAYLASGVWIDQTFSNVSKVSPPMTIWRRHTAP